jgi:hypothetical protein
MALTKAKLIADGVIDVDNLAAGHSITTSNIGEGSNLYYTDARVASYLTTLSSLTVSGDVSIADKIIHTGDTDTAIRFPAADTVTIETEGSEKFRITPAGRVGIGTSTPSASLHIFREDTVTTQTNTDFILENPTSGNARFFLKTASAFNRNWEFFASGSDGAFGIYDGVGAARRLTILPSGNVGIGIASPASLLHVNGDVAITDKIIHAGDTNTAIRFPAADTVTVETNGSERLRIDSSGNVLVGKTIDDDNTNGIRLISQGAIAASRNNNLSLILNRTGTDGKVAIFRKDDTEVGSISVTATGASIRLGGNTTANELDDYEEGTWSPVYVPSTGTFTTMTMDIINASYTKIGRLVTIVAQIRTDDVDVTGGSGNVLISGLPYTVVQSSGGGGAISVGYTSGFVNAPTNGGFTNNATTIILRVGTTPMAVADLTDGTSANENTLYFAASYFTS